MEEIKHAKPIAMIPPQSLLAGELHQLRQRRRGLGAEASIQENERQQNLVKQRLIAMGRADLTEV